MTNIVVILIKSAAGAKKIAFTNTFVVGNNTKIRWINRSIFVLELAITKFSAKSINNRSIFSVGIRSGGGRLLTQTR